MIPLSDRSWHLGRQAKASLLFVSERVLVFLVFVYSLDPDAKAVVDDDEFGSMFFCQAAAPGGIVGLTVSVQHKGIHDVRYVFGIGPPVVKICLPFDLLELLGVDVSFDLPKLLADPVHVIFFVVSFFFELCSHLSSPLSFKKEIFLNVFFVVFMNVYTVEFVRYSEVA